MKSQNIDSDEIDISTILSIIWRRKWLSLAIIIISFLISFFYYNSTSNTIYTSKIDIQINLDSKGAIPILQGLPLGIQNSNNYGTEIELIKSRKLLLEVVNQLKLKEKSFNIPYDDKISSSLPFNFEYIEDKIRKMKVFLSLNTKKYQTLSDEIILTKKLQNMLSITSSEASKFITISITSYSPELSTKLVNSIADTYINYKAEEIKKQREKTLLWLSNELNIIKKDIIKSEKELNPLSKNKNHTDIKIMMQLKEEELNLISNKKNELEQKIEIDKIHYKNLEGIKNPIIILESPLLNPTLQIENTQNRVSIAEKALLEKSLKYGPKHPLYITYKLNLSNEKATLNRQVNNLLKTQKMIFEIEKNKIKSLNKLLLNIKDELKKLSRSEEIYLKKLREVEANRNLYSMTLKRFQETQSISNFKQEIASILDYSLVEDAKKTSKNNLISVLIVILGILFSLTINMVLGFIDQRIHNNNDLNTLTKIPTLTNLPKIKNKKNSNTPYNFIKNKAYMESIYRLRTRLRTIDRNIITIVISSAIPKEGKSTTTLHLAKALSELEKVLVIDIDFRRHSITKHLNIPSEKIGLSDIILKSAKLSNAIMRNTKEGFDILGVGTALESPNALLSSDTMKKLLIHLKKHYDRVIIETPPIQLFSDTEMVSKLVDCTLLIVKSGYTKKKDLVESIDKLEKINIKILGLIFNQTESKIKKKYYNQYIQDSKI